MAGFFLAASGVFSCTCPSCLGASKRGSWQGGVWEGGLRRSLILGWGHGGRITAASSIAWTATVWFVLWNGGHCCGLRGIFVGVGSHDCISSLVRLELSLNLEKDSRKSFDAKFGS